MKRAYLIDVDKFAHELASSREMRESAKLVTNYKWKRQ